MTFSFARAWVDAQWLWRAHAEFIPVLAGLFVMVPFFAMVLFLPFPVPESGQLTLEALEAYSEDNRWPLLLFNLVILFGSASILGLMLDARRPTVGEALRTAFVMLPGLAVLSLLLQFVLTIGVLLFVVPGVYLLGRLALALPWQMAHRDINPLRALVRAFELTRGNGWSVAGLLLAVIVAGWIAATVIGTLVGVVVALVIPASSLAAVAGFISAILVTMLIVALLLAVAATYRQLAPSAT